MKINYKNTALGLIDDPDNFNFGFPDPDITPMRTSEELREFGMSIIKGSHALKKMCGDNIEFISSTFHDAFVKAFPKIKNLFYKEEINEAGILISGGHTGLYTHYHTYYYAVTTIKNNDEIVGYNIIFMDFSKHAQAKEHALDVFVTVTSNEKENDITIKSSIWNGYANDGKNVTYWEIFIISFLLFKKYCDIETKEISPKNRRAKIGSEKYLNETDKRIKILDATWFTNLVVSGAFEVEGHLHWYYYGPGKKQKKLQWVETYQKKGLY